MFAVASKNFDSQAAALRLARVFALPEAIDEVQQGDTYGYSQGAAMLQVHLTTPPNERALREGCGWW